MRTLIKRSVGRQNGFGMIEVLVSMILIAIGILGMVALQSRSVAYTQDSVQRNKAIALTADLVEIIRTNPQEVFASLPTTTSPFYGVFKDSSIFYKEEGAPFDPAPGVCPALPTQPADQLACWWSEVTTTLPGDDELFEEHIYICRSSTRGECDDAGSILEIQMAWLVKPGDCPDSRAPNDTTCVFRTRVEL